MELSYTVAYGFPPECFTGIGQFCNYYLLVRTLHTLQSPSTIQTMAVFDFIKGIEVTIRVDGQALQEYDDDEIEVKPGDVGEYQASWTVSKYIEAVGDKEFSIHISVGSPYKLDCPSLLFSTFVDGVGVPSPVCSKRHYQSNSFDAKVEGVTSGPDGRRILKPFKFSSIKTTTEDSSLGNIKDDSKLLETIGAIRVILQRRSEMTNVAHPRLAPLKMKPTLQVHEKALKGQAITHGTGLGLPKPAERSNIVSTTSLDGDNYPLAIFNFKYRSKEALQQLLIIERTPEPEPTPARSITPRNTPSISLDSLDATQKSKLERFLQDLVGGNSSSTPDRKIKRERDDNGSSGGSQASKKSKRMITVDLTADSDDENIEALN